MQLSQNIRLLGAIIIIGAIIYYVQLQQPMKINPLVGIQATVSSQALSKESQKSTKYPPAQELVSPSGFINTAPFKIHDLIGKQVILIDFWTYSCINCQRSLPYVTSWQEKYGDKGLTIIGVHTPEFQFEHDIANVKKAVEKFGIKYPVVLDNDYGTWTAYNNQYWPRKYLIDIDGYITYDHIGEGGYDETEQKIQAALQERAQKLGQVTNMDTNIVQPKDVSTNESTSPETYFGAFRNDLLVNGAIHTPGTNIFSEPASPIKANSLYLTGKWSIEREFAEASAAGTKITYKYSAKDLYFVAAANTPVKIKVLRDGKPVSDQHAAGEDVDSTSHATIQENRLYKLIHDTAPGQHTIEILIENPTLQAYTFTFG